MYTVIHIKFIIIMYMYIVCYSFKDSFLYEYRPDFFQFIFCLSGFCTIYVGKVYVYAKFNNIAKVLLCICEILFKQSMRVFPNLLNGTSTPSSKESVGIGTGTPSVTCRWWSKTWPCRKPFGAQKIHPVTIYLTKKKNRMHTLSQYCTVAGAQIAGLS